MVEAILVSLVFVLCFCPPLLVLVLTCLAPWRIWWIREAEDSPPQVIRRAAAVTAVIFVVSLGLFAPLRAVSVAALDVGLVGRSLDPGLQGPLTLMLLDPQFWGPTLLRRLDSGIGMLGMAFGAVAFLGFYISNLRLRRVIESLPTSTARAAAVGLVELQGVARAAEGHDLKRQKKESHHGKGTPVDWGYNPADAILFSGHQAYLSE